MDPLTIAALGAQVLQAQKKNEQNQIPLVPTSGQGVGAIQRRMQAQEESNPLSTIQMGLSALDKLDLDPKDKAQAADVLTSAKQELAPPQPMEMGPKPIAPVPRRQFYG